MKKFIKKVIINKNTYKIFKPELSPKNVRARSVWWFLFRSKSKGIS